MSESKTDNIEGEPSEVVDCRDLARSLAANHFEFDVYALNITLILIDEENKLWSACLDAVPGDVVPLYLEYLHAEIESCDFKPHPGPFMYGGESDADIERVKLKMRPRYVELVRFVRNKFA
jgi:hypothetical protein